MPSDVTVELTNRGILKGEIKLNQSDFRSALGRVTLLLYYRDNPDENIRLLKYRKPNEFGDDIYPVFNVPNTDWELEVADKSILSRMEAIFVVVVPAEIQLYMSKIQYLTDDEVPVIEEIIDLLPLRPFAHVTLVQGQTGLLGGFQWQYQRIASCSGESIRSSSGSIPTGNECNSSNRGALAICWDGDTFSNPQSSAGPRSCTYYRQFTTNCERGIFPGRVYECVRVQD